MQNRGLLIAAAALALLLGLLYWSNRHKPDEGTLVSATPAEASPKILSLNEAEIGKIELKKKAGDQVTLARNDSDKWQITTPQPLEVDDAAVSGMLSTLSALNSERLVEEKATNFGQYGLAAPALEVVITDKKNATHKLLVGDDTPTGNGAYARLDGDARVFTIASYTKTSIDKNLNDLRDKRLITVDADKISRVELTLKQQHIEFGRDKDQWQILKPKPLRADATQIDELVRKLTDAKMDTGPDTDAGKVASAFGAGTVIATVNVTTEKGRQQLEVRKQKEDYYAKSSVVPGVYKVSGELGQVLDKKLEDFRNKKLFDFGLNDPEKIEIHDGSKTYFLTKGGEDWFSGEGKKLEGMSVLSLVDNLRDLQATDFADSGFTTAAMEIYVTSNGGKRVEKVLLSKGDNKTVAKREGESTLYVLDSKVIEDLQKQASDLKPEASPQK